MFSRKLMAILSLFMVGSSIGMNFDDEMKKIEREFQESQRKYEETQRKNKVAYEQEQKKSKAALDKKLRELSADQAAQRAVSDAQIAQRIRKMDQQNDQNKGAIDQYLQNVTAVNASISATTHALMDRFMRGETLTPEEMQAHYALMDQASQQIDKSSAECSAQIARK